MSALLDLSDEELARLAPAEVERLEAAFWSRVDYAPAWDHRMWDAAVDRWNLCFLPNERRARHAICARFRHRWVKLPIERALCCARCLAYKVVEE